MRRIIEELRLGDVSDDTVLSRDLARRPPNLGEYEVLIGYLPTHVMPETSMVVAEHAWDRYHFADYLVLASVSTAAGGGEILTSAELDEAWSISDSLDALIRLNPMDAGMLSAITQGGGYFFDAEAMMRVVAELISRHVFESYALVLADAVAFAQGGKEPFTAGEGRTPQELYRELAGVDLGSLIEAHNADEDEEDLPLAHQILDMEDFETLRVLVEEEWDAWVVSDLAPWYLLDVLEENVFWEEDDPDGPRVEREDVLEDELMEGLDGVVYELEGQAQWGMWSSHPPRPGDWITSYEDSEAGFGHDDPDSVTHSAWIKRRDGGPLSWSEMSYIHQALGLYGNFPTEEEWKSR